jgi:hypothetical protein
MRRSALSRCQAWMFLNGGGLTALELAEAAAARYGAEAWLEDPDHMLWVWARLYAGKPKKKAG